MLSGPLLLIVIVHWLRFKSPIALAMLFHTLLF